MQCPFTWKSDPMDPRYFEHCIDKLYIVGQGWSAVCDRLSLYPSHFRQKKAFCILAYGLLSDGREEEGRAMLVSVYAMLLPLRGETSDKDIRRSVVDDYRQALRHVLDACWFGMQATMCPCPPPLEAKYLAAFARSITPFEQLHEHQQAAVMSLRAMLMEDREMARQCVAMNPAEGQWRYLVGSQLRSARSKGVTGMPLLYGRPSTEELTMLRDAFRLRRIPEYGLRLAKTLADTATGGVEALQLVNEALKQFPEDASVMYMAADVLLALRVGSRSKLAARAEQLYRRAVSLAPTPCATLHMDLSVMLCEQGKLAAAKREREEAFRVNRLAVNLHGDDPGILEEMAKLSGLCRKYL